MLQKYTCYANISRKKRSNLFSSYLKNFVANQIGQIPATQSLVDVDLPLYCSGYGIKREIKRQLVNPSSSHLLNATQILINNSYERSRDFKDSNVIRSIARRPTRNVEFRACIDPFTRDERSARLNSVGR